MGDPPPVSLPRLRKNPTFITTTTTATNPPRKLKFFCCFNGVFRFQSPLSNQLKYIGGETRVISIDHSISFSKLRSKISHLCPKLLSFSLKYQIFVSGRVCAPATGTRLVSLDSDQSVRRMVEECDKLEFYGKLARVWIFVVRDAVTCDDSCVSDVKCDVDDNDHHLFSGLDSVRHEAQLCKPQFDDKLAEMHVNVDYDDESRRNFFLKEQLLMTKLERIRVSGLDGNNLCEREVSSGDDAKYKYYHPLIDLGPEQSVSEDLENPFQRCLIDHKLRNANFEGRENYSNLVQNPVHGLHPLNPRDGNLRVEMNGPVHLFPGQNVGAFHSGGRFGIGNLNLLNQCSANQLHNGADREQVLWNVGQEYRKNLNRENIMPWDTAPDSQSFSHRWDGNAYSVKSAGQRVWGSYQDGIRYHKANVNEVRNQQIHPYQIRSHGNLTNIGSNQSVRPEGKHSSGNFYLGLRPNIKIAEQGHSMQSYCTNYLEPTFPEDPFERRLIMRDTGFYKDISTIASFRQQSGVDVTHYGNFTTRESHLPYHDSDTFVARNSSSSHNAIYTPSCYVGAMETQKDLLTGSLSHCQDYQGLSIKNESSLGQQKVVTTSDLFNNFGNCDSTKQECNVKLVDTGGDCKLLNQSIGHHCLQGRLASSVDLLKKPFVLSSKEVATAALPSLANIDVSNALLKAEAKHLDLTNEGQFSIGPKAEGATLVTSIPSSQKDDDKVSTKCSRVIGGISSNLAAFYTHLGAQELQTIKSSDLEYIKELGSGTYGTVHHGKWKGSDVAVKKIKASCFTGGSLEDQLVADFWKEAHILGQLHHPNIVAFYGVVTDSPVNNLATVTEYMVNGSLKQVLRRKDRTIDRRKRLILAMDAAFGMEYLHGKNIVHFDLKSHNLLVNMRDPQRPVCKIGDLGLSKIKQRTLVSGGVRGTIPWMAPELLQNRMVTEKVDVFSFGIIMWELLTGEEPYAGMRSEEIIAGIIQGTLRPEIPSWCDQVWRSLMERCWSFDPETRPAFSEIAKELRAMSTAMNIK